VDFRTCSEETSVVKTGAQPRTFAFVSLGCPKNLVDSERMLGLLAAEGYVLTPDPDGADFVVVNTCGFIDAARQESLAVLQEMAELKRQGRVGGLIVAGCLAERLKERLLELVPEIDGVFGVFAREDIARVVDRFLSPLEEQRVLFRPATSRLWDDRARLRITPRHLAYLKISEGCDRLCTFCAIPKMRGPHVSKPLEQIVAEAEELAADGVRELNIVAQDTTYYGVDLYGKPKLSELLRRLEEIRALRWIRLLYCYPQNFTDELIATIAASGKVLPYLDIPLQHINDRILRRMKRRVTRAEIVELIRRLRAEIPGLVLRTTFIVGFPGESEAEFEELCEFVRETRFERLGVFEYSLEPDTPAARLPEQVPSEVKQARRQRLMELQQEIAFAWNAARVGSRLQVLIDQVDRRRGWYVGRSYADAPEIDAQVFVQGSGLRPGHFVEVTVTDWDGYDLMARAQGDLAEGQARPVRAQARRPP
jgi:ribosomal protein S12 methylthiotransferase